MATCEQTASLDVAISQYRICEWNTLMASVMTAPSHAGMPTVPPGLTWFGTFDQQTRYGGFNDRLFYFLNSGIFGYAASPDYSILWPAGGWEDSGTFTQLYYSSLTGRWNLWIVYTDDATQDIWFGQTAPGANPDNASGVYYKSYPSTDSSFFPQYMTIVPLDDTCPDCNWAPVALADLEWEDLGSGSGGGTWGGSMSGASGTFTASIAASAFGAATAQWSTHICIDTPKNIRCIMNGTGAGNASTSYYLAFQVDGLIVANVPGSGAGYSDVLDHTELLSAGTHEIQVYAHVQNNGIVSGANLSGDITVSFP